MRRAIVIAIIGSLAGLLTLTTNCDNVHLSLIQKAELQSVSALKGPVCAAEPTTYQTVTKIMFLVDKSGSNFGNGTSIFVDPVGGGTDVDKSYRRGSIQTFLDKHRSAMGPAGKLFMGYIAFGTLDNGSGDGAQPYINDPLNPGKAGFSNDPAMMDAALARLGSTADGGSTPYHAAIDLALDAINTDKAALGQNSTAIYLVVLISDGVPTDTIYMTNGALDQAKINLDFDRLKLVHATLSTVYYGPKSPPDASVRLGLMALEGKGSYLDTNVQGRDVPLDKIIGYQFGEPWQIRSFVVTNLNAAPCDDGTMGVDTDADGLCDKDEISYNTDWSADRIARMNGKKFDPYNRNSFNPSFNDLIYHEHITKTSFIDESCSPTKDANGNIVDEDMDLLNDCEEAYIKIANAATASGPNADWTSRMQTDTDPKNFDSDGDGFTDWMEFVFERSAAAAMNYNSISRAIDGFRMDEIMLKHLNPANPRGSIAYDGKLLRLPVNETSQNCYQYTQTVLPVYPSHKITAENVSGYAPLAHEADENVVLIYYIQTPQSDPNGPGQMLYQFKKLKVGQALNVDFDYKNFTAISAGASRAVPTN